MHPNNRQQARMGKPVYLLCCSGLQSLHLQLCVEVASFRFATCLTVRWHLP